MNKLPQNKSSIARRFIFYIILFSSFITLIITAFQLYRDYNTDINLIHTELEQVERVHLGSLTAALWASNSKLLQTNLEGILQIRDIQYVEIHDAQKVWAEAGEIKGDNNIKRQYTMNYRHRNKDINIGELTVNVSLDGVYQRLYDKVWVILISNAVKTALVAFFIYFLFHRLVARHLSTISKFSEQHDPLSNNTSLSLERSSKQHDEFDAVVESINDMHARLHEQISEINQQKQYLSQTLNSIGDAVITTDDKGNVTRLNPVAEQLTGWTNDEAQKQSLKTIFPIVNASTGESITNPVDKVLASGETVYLSNHTTLIAKDGKEYQIADSAAPIRNDDKILGMVLVFNDVTEQYRMREALHESEQRLRQLAENLYEVFWLGSPDWNEVIYISPAYEKNWGFSAEDLYKNPCIWIESVHPDDREQVIKDIPVNPNDITGYVDFREYRIVKNDGEILWIKARAYPVYDIDGKIIRIAGIAEDITARKQADETMRRSQKMDALGKLTGGIAHDYNNMLGVVLGYAELLQENLQNQPELAGYVNEITHAGERGAKLTKKLLAFSKNESSDIEVININTVVQDELHMLEKTLTARIKLELNLENDLWSVALDESELEDALLNMSINAMHAIENNGRLTIETSNEKINAADGERLDLKSVECIRLSISDTGCGMDAATKEKIFDPFYSTKGDKGTGLGLSQVYGFIHRCGGSIKVDSEPEQGSRFTLYFPRYQGEEANQAPAEVKNISDLKGKATILVVDDEPALLKLTCEILSQQGYRIFCAERVKQALEIMETEDIDLLFTDIIMPDMNGYELASLVQKKYPSIKIQLASGYSDNQSKNRVDESLHQQMLNKPYNAQTLLRKIRALLQ